MRARVERRCQCQLVRRGDLWRRRRVNRTLLPQKPFFFFLFHRARSQSETTRLTPVLQSSFRCVYQQPRGPGANRQAREARQGKARQREAGSQPDKQAVVSATVIRGIGIDRTEDLRFNPFPTFRFVDACPSRTTGSRRIRRSSIHRVRSFSPANPYFCFPSFGGPLSPPEEDHPPGRIVFGEEPTRTHTHTQWYSIPVGP